MKIQWTIRNVEHTVGSSRIIGNRWSFPCFQKFFKPVTKSFGVEKKNEFPNSSSIIWQRDSAQGKLVRSDLNQQHRNSLPFLIPCFPTRRMETELSRPLRPSGIHFSTPLPILFPISTGKYQRVMNSASSILEASAFPRRLWTTEKPFESQYICSNKWKHSNWWECFYNFSCVHPNARTGSPIQDGTGK